MIPIRAGATRAQPHASAMGRSTLSVIPVAAVTVAGQAASRFAQPPTTALER